MLSRWSNYLIEKNIIQPADAEIQQYGMFILLENIAFHAAQFVAAIALGLVAETLLFDAVFLLLRGHAGGYHASTPVRCFFMSIAIWAALMAGSHYMPSLACIVLGLISMVVIWMLGPIPHQNNPLSPARFAHTRKIMRAVLLGAGVLSALLFVLGWAVGGRLVLLVLFSTALSLIATKNSTSYQRL